jgi:hypothetical protein
MSRLSLSRGSSESLQVAPNDATEFFIVILNDISEIRMKGNYDQWLPEVSLNLFFP